MTIIACNLYSCNGNFHPKPSASTCKAIPKSSVLILLKVTEFIKYSVASTHEKIMRETSKHMLKIVTSLFLKSMYSF